MTLRRVLPAHQIIFLPWTPPSIHINQPYLPSAHLRIHLTLSNSPRHLPILKIWTPSHQAQCQEILPREAMVALYRLLATPTRSAGILSLSGHFPQCKRFPDIPHLKQSLQETQDHLQHFGETKDVHENCFFVNFSVSRSVVNLALFSKLLWLLYRSSFVFNSFFPQAIHNRQGRIIWLIVCPSSISISKYARC